MHIGYKIKKLRELRNLTQEHVANCIGISQGAYSRMELGETEITYSKLEKISKELGMNPEEVIVFNLMTNETSNRLVINNSQTPEAEKKLYEQQINLLKEDNAYLKKIIEGLFNR